MLLSSYQDGFLMERIKITMKKRKLGIGACLACLGVLGIVLGSTLGLTELGRPWSFLLGFTFGVMAGAGTTLTIAGLAGLRRPPTDE